MSGVTKFEVGGTYCCRSAGDRDCVFSFAVADRTEKTVVLRSSRGEVRRKVRVRNDVEEVDPFGRYSMSPVLKADRGWT